MRLKEGDQRRKQSRIASLAPKLVCPDSGQIQEPLGPAVVRKRCRKRGKGNREWIVWRLG